jgi:hypothetical protein
MQTGNGMLSGLPGASYAFYEDSSANGNAGMPMVSVVEVLRNFAVAVVVIVHHVASNGW